MLFLLALSIYRLYIDIQNQCIFKYHIYSLYNMNILNVSQFCMSNFNSIPVGVLISFTPYKNTTKELQVEDHTYLEPEYNKAITSRSHIPVTRIQQSNYK